MKISEIQNRVKKNRRVVVYEEKYTKSGDVRYRVDTYEEKRGVEKLTEQMPFKNRGAAETYAKFKLEK